MKNFIIAILLVGVVALAGITIATLPTFLGNQQKQSSNNNTTLVSTSGNTTNSTTFATTSSNTTSLGGSLLIALNPTNRLLAPGLNNNFTLTLFRSGALSGSLSFSATSPSGLSAAFTPSSINLIGNEQAVDVEIRAASDVFPGTYGVTIQAKGSTGEFSQTFQVQVLRYLVLIAVNGRAFFPANLTVTGGSPVTWMNLDGGSDEASGAHSLKFVPLGIISPVLSRYDTWTHIFVEPGSFQYYDPNIPQYTGEIIVSG